MQTEILSQRHIPPGVRRNRYPVSNRASIIGRTDPGAHMRGGKTGAEGGLLIIWRQIKKATTIEAKKKKIKRLFREMPPEKRQFAEGLINQFAVTSVTLERLADEINNGDLIEDFVQGAQKLRRESPALRAYNTTIKSFSALTNQLVALLPEKEKKSAGDELMSFITKPAARSGK